MAARSVSGTIFNDLFYLYMAIAVIVGGLVIGWLAYILVKYRARPGDARPRDAPRGGVLPAERGHPLWSYVMAVVIAAIMFGLAFGTISAAHDLETPPEDREWLQINVIGFQFGWKVEYVGAGGILVSRINDWTIPVETPVVANVTSQDVWHNFALPEYRVRIDVVPGQTNHLWWEAHDVGTVEPVCVQLCGVGHALMKAKMHVVPQDEFATWLADRSQEEYQRLERAGQIVNVTYDGERFSSANATVNTERAYAVRVANEGGAEERFTFGEHVVTLAPGATGLVYAPPRARMLEALGTDATFELGGA